MTATTQPKLSAAQAKQLVTAEVEAAKLKAELEAANRRVAELRERFKPRLAPSEDPKDAGKDVLVAEAGGFLIRCATFVGGDYFSLKAYREAGHEITPAMAEHIHSGDPRERWTWKDLRGPRHPDAVEPA
jgi:hypothetical protein